MKRRGGFTLVELLIVIMIIAILAGMMLLATGSATDSAEATKVINDLRAVKSATLLYMADNNSWPAASVGTALDLYLDRPFDTARYTDLRVVSGDTTGERELIGFTLAGNTVNKAGVRNKIQSKAAESGIFAIGGVSYTGGSDVFMNMR